MFDYDDSDVDSVLDYSQLLTQLTLGEIIEKYNASPYKSYSDYQLRIPSKADKVEIKSGSKGRYGNYIEEYFYGYKQNSNSAADFEKIGVELKVTPYKVNKNQTVAAKERLVLTMVNYDNYRENESDDFYKSHLWQKCEKILLLFYDGLSSGGDINKQKIAKVFLYEWFDEDLPQILADYKKIVEKIKQGKAHELSESDGMYLSTCTKGAGHGKNMRQQPFSKTLAKQRAWALKSSYMSYLIKNRIFNQAETESIVAAATKKPFTQFIEEQVLAHRGKTGAEIAELYGLESDAKNKLNLLVKKILKVNGNPEETREFLKSNMNLRVIRLNAAGLPKEDSPFKCYEFKELAKHDDWETSHVYTEIYAKQYCFVVFREVKEEVFVLEDVKFWGFPERMEEDVKKVWHQTRQIIRDGVELSFGIRQQKNDTNKITITVSTNFPKGEDNRILYTKVHASKTYYELKSRVVLKSGGPGNASELPDGRKITKHSFWFTKQFLKEVLEGRWD